MHGSKKGTRITNDHATSMNFELWPRLQCACPVPLLRSSMATSITGIILVVSLWGGKVLGGSKSEA